MATIKYNITMDLANQHEVDLLILGGGIAGLAALRTVLDQRFSSAPRILLVDKGRQVGGRMALRRRGDASYDTGAQFFTARSPAFASTVERAVADGVVVEWFSAAESVWRGVNGMTDLPKWLAGGIRADVEQSTSPVEIALGTRVASLARRIDGEAGFVATFEKDRGPVNSAAVIASAPVPQLLELSSPEVISSLPDELRNISYDPCLVLLIEIDQPAPEWLGANGMGRINAFGIDLIVDNVVKGISPKARGAWTVHLSAEISQLHYDRDDRATTVALVDHLVDALRHAFPEWARSESGITIVDEIAKSPNTDRVQLKKWRYARPATSTPNHFLSSDQGDFYVIGDAFGGPRVEGAYISGTEAAGKWCRVWESAPA